MRDEQGLVAFAREIIGYAFDGMDADGADIQALALAHGLLVKEPYDPARHGPSMEAQPGDDWYTFAGPMVEASETARQSRAPEDGAQAPSEPSPGLLMSMAMRYDHSLGMPGYRDWKLAPGIGEKEPGLHARILANTMGSMRQLWEEVTGNGFYSPAREADYVASAKRCGVTFDEIGRPMALPLQPEGERNA